MQIEFYPEGLNLSRPTLLVRGAVLSSSARIPAASKSSGNRTQNNTSSGNSTSTSDSVEISSEGKRLANQLTSDSLNPAESITKIGSEKTEKLSEEEEKQIDELKQTDREVRQHENAHKAAAGDLAVGGASYDYEEGPDGKRYATGGEVKISVGGGDSPEEKLENAQRAERAATAPSNPSSEDRAIAAKARKVQAEARSEMADEDDTTETAATALGNRNDIYSVYSSLSESNYSAGKVLTTASPVNLYA